MKPNIATLPDIKTTPKPFLKWAGGKRSLLPQFKRFFTAAGSYNRYFEPFVGSGAVFFWLRPEQSLLFDLNQDLIDTYRVVRDQLPELVTVLEAHALQHSKAFYYDIRARDSDRLNRVERAARFIYLNRTCYNGLYRVNQSGQFNVPFGNYKNPTICDVATLSAASKALQGAQLDVSDFEDALQGAEKGDLIYFDPPYQPLSKSSSFTSYTGGGFNATDQERLANLFINLDRRGCRVLLSNSNAPLIRDLYKGFNIHEIEARRAINSKANGRGPITELLITNF